MLLMPILTPFQAFQLKNSHFFRHNKVADIYVRRKHERKQNEHTTQGIRRSPPEKTHAGKSPQDGMAVRADTGACAGSGGSVSVPSADLHCRCQNRKEDKPPVRTGTQDKAVSETGTGCGSRRRFRSGDVPQHEPVLSAARIGQTAQHTDRAGVSCGEAAPRYLALPQDRRTLRSNASAGASSTRRQGHCRRTCVCLALCGGRSWAGTGLPEDDSALPCRCHGFAFSTACGFLRHRHGSGSGGWSFPIRGCRRRCAGSRRNGMVSDRPEADLRTAPMGTHCGSASGHP